jgi:hypothetical protein
VLRTYDSVFDHTAVWYTLLADLLIVGLNDPDSALDVERIAERAALPDFAAGLKRSGVDSLEALLAHELLPLGVIRAAALEGPLHTILHPRLNHQAVHGFFIGKQAELPFTGFGRPAQVGRENSLLLRRLARYRGKPPVEVRKSIADQVCKSRPHPCVSHVAHWMAEAPGSDDLADAVEQVKAWERREDKRGTGQALEDARTLLLANGDKSSVSPAVARRASEVFRDYYTHGAPLDPARLDAVWGRCSDSLQSHACAEGRRRARRLTEQGSAR